MSSRSRTAAIGSRIGRWIADGAVAAFSRGANERILVGQPMPDFSRAEPGN